MSHQAYDLVTYSDPRTYTNAVQDFLEEREAENGLFLGQLTRLNDTPASTTPFMVAVKAGPSMISAAFYSELYLIVTRGPEEIWQIIVSKLKEAGLDIPTVVGPAVETEKFATMWAQARGCDSQLAINQRLYQLTQVNPQTGIPGSARLVTDNDVDTLILWIQEFFQEILAWETPPIEQIQENARARVPLRMTYFWEVEGKAVAMAALARPSRRGIAINTVYTPPKYRRRGYATALVAALSAEGLGRGKSFCILYTDVLNSTSNSIYQKIGYQPVSDWRHYRFRY
jgi:GNAT superfamily N-acetyltransferase